jgi:hypothetical protein
MTTVEKVLLDVRALFDELTKNGTLLGESAVADMQASGIRFVDLAQKELYRTGNFYKKFEVTQKNPVNLLENNNGFELLEFIGTDYITHEHLAKSYYFEADDEGQCVIEEYESGAWIMLEMITLASASSMQVYKGLIPPTTTANNFVRLRFTGISYYKMQNIAMFKEPFKVDKIPNYRAWIKYEMPSDFRLVDSVIEEYPLSTRSVVGNYKWEGFKELWVDYFYQGTIVVIYKPVPTTVTALTDVLEIDDITANAIVYYVAAKIAPHENKDIITICENKYRELKIESSITSPATEQTIEDVYGGYYG